MAGRPPGGVLVSTDPIVVAYDPIWPKEFAALASVLAEALGPIAREIHHVGSTAIPGMAAKPILDIDVELAPGVHAAAVSAALARLGYEYQGDQGISGRYAYRSLSPAVPFCKERAVWPHHHLYVCPHDSMELERHLRFRNRLRSSAQLRKEYLQVKQEALARAKGVRQVYVDEKERLGLAFFRKVLG